MASLTLESLAPHEKPTLAWAEPAIIVDRMSAAQARRARIGFSGEGDGRHSPLRPYWTALERDHVAWSRGSCGAADSAGVRTACAFSTSSLAQHALNKSFIDVSLVCCFRSPAIAPIRLLHNNPAIFQRASASDLVAHFHTFCTNFLGHDARGKQQECKNYD